MPRRSMAALSWTSWLIFSGNVSRGTRSSIRVLNGSVRSRKEAVAIAGEMLIRFGVGKHGGRGREPVRVAGGGRDKGDCRNRARKRSPAREEVSPPNDRETGLFRREGRRGQNEP